MLCEGIVTPAAWAPWLRLELTIVAALDICPYRRDTGPVVRCNRLAWWPGLDLSEQKMSENRHSESELLQLFRNAIQSVNTRLAKHYHFVHGTPDGQYENLAEDWNDKNFDKRAVGEIKGESDFGLERQVTVSLHQSSSMVTFSLLEAFEEHWLFPLDAAAQYNFLTDLIGNVSFVFMPHQVGGTSRLSVGGLRSRTVLDHAGMSLGQSLEDLAMARTFVDSRIRGGGKDSWSENVAMMAELDPQFTQIQTPDSGLSPLLEAVAATTPREKWQVSSLDSINSVFVWDSRSNHYMARLTDIEPELGYITAAAVVEDRGVTYHGRLIRAMAFNLNETTDRIRHRYLSED